MGRRIISKKDIFGETKFSPMLNFVAPGGIPSTGAGESTDKDKLQPDDYKTKVIKYIPAEIVTAFVTLEGIIKSSTQASTEVYWLVFLVLLAITPLYIWRVTNDPKLSPAWDQIIIGFFSFALWVFALGGPFESMVWYKPLYGALLLPIFTLVVPLFRD